MAIAFYFKVERLFVARRIGRVLQSLLTSSSFFKPLYGNTARVIRAAILFPAKSLIWSLKAIRFIFLAFRQARLIDQVEVLDQHSIVLFWIPLPTPSTGFTKSDDCILSFHPGDKFEILLIGQANVWALDGGMPEGIHDA